MPRLPEPIRVNRAYAEAKRKYDALPEPKRFERRSMQRIALEQELSRLRCKQIAIALAEERAARRAASQRRKKAA